MADYQLTQTGAEVQDILDNAQSGKYFYNQSVATWASDATYSDYPYKGTITINGVKGTDGVEVTFSNADATSGNYAPICNTVANGVEIWAKAQDNALTIPTIHITTGADVQLSGGDSYLPISGGNITGSLSVVGKQVLTTLTVTALVELREIPQNTATEYACNWQDYDFLILEAKQYNNVFFSETVPYAYFSITGSGSRPVLTDTAHSRTYEIWQNGSGKIIVLSNGSSSSAYGIRITGIKIS